MRRRRVALLLVVTVNACSLRPGPPLGPGPDAFDRNGFARLHYAARAGDLEALTALLGDGADPNLRDGRHNGWTPLQHAIHRRQGEAALFLLGRGARPDERGGQGVLPLHMAAGTGQARLVRALLDAGADPRSEVDGRTALWAAAGGGAIGDLTDGPPLGTCYPEVLQELRGAAPELTLADGWSTSVLRWFADTPECVALIDALRAGARPPA